ncbi:hypothetical protein O1611_g7549 [Lasiodiplodia mahajangana]|uniref:Uncharacterized protein n=1 Tax=Lasiodiplodia mahajangana TaxID=1108764 RepID=A0ACC2JF87_9PEZI|nr:hypothetical protein O1611_g7549 [Lasiodiplodia mahajangana]
MKNKNPPDERVVYLALKNVFKGANAEVRQLKVVRKLITKSQQDADVADLINAHNIDTVCNIARTLLTEEIFESTLKAKIRFPEVFDVSPAQSAEREASEAEAAINDANAIAGAVQGYSEDVQNIISRADVADTESVETCHNPKLPAVQSTHSVPSLFPIYLPLRTQHRILTDVQRILEDACFDFGQRAMPDILKRKRWDCSEAAELNLWAAELLQRQSEFANRADNIGQPLTKLLRSVADIRHTAVHRICISARGLEQFLLNAESLATLLGDTTRLKSLTELRRSIQQAMEELERNKHVLGSKLRETLKRVAAQRAELDRIEEIAISDMLREDGEYQAFAGKNLEETILSSSVPASVMPVKEDESSSNIDDVDTIEDDSRLS